MRQVSEEIPRDQANQAYFDRWAENYDSGRITKWFQYTQQLTVGLMDLKPQSKVLDVGCGTGFAVLLLSSMLSEGQACGVDISAEMVAQAQAKVSPELGDRVEFQ